MTWLRVLASRVLGLFSRPRADGELSDEIVAHLDRLTDEHIKRGLSYVDARSAARRAFGGAEPIKEAYRDQRGLPFLEVLARDLKVAVRGLKRAPGLAIAVSLTLGLGICATTVVYSWLSAVLTAAAPIRNRDRLVGVWLHKEAQGETKTVLSVADFEVLRQRQSSFDLFAAQRPGAVNLSGIDQAVRVEASFVTSDYFEVLSTQPVLGRGFSRADERPGAPRVAVLGYRFWQNRFGGRRDVVGQLVRLDDQPTTIVGVLPRNDYSPEVLTPLPINPQSSDYRERALFVSARLGPGIELERARATMQGIGRALEREQPDAYRGWSINARPLEEEFVGREARLVFGLVAAAAGTILLIACVNIANLLLARGLSRSRELAVRTALGASRLRLIRQMLAEGLLLASLGGACGVLASHWGLQVLRRAMAEGAPYMERALVDARVLAFAAAATMLSTVLFALLPAVQTTRSRPSAALRDGAHSTTGPRARRLHSLLVGSEVAMAALLMVVAVLFVRGLIAIQGIAPGFDTRNLLTLRVSPSPSRYSEGADVAGFYSRVVERLRNLPGVTMAGATARVPAAGSRFNPNRTVVIEGRPPTDDTRFADDLTITPGYLEALRVPLRQGRGLAESDVAVTPLVVVVNDTMARRYWPGASPLGARIRLGDEPSLEVWRTVVGVVGDVRNDDVDAPPLPHVYVPLAQRPSREMTLVIRTLGDPTRHVDGARAAVAAVDRDQPLFDIKTMAQIFDEDLRQTVVLVGFAGIFAGVALVLAAVGIYGVVAHRVALARMEIGIRLALGASTRSVVGWVMRQGLGPVALGLVAGVTSGLGLSRLLAGMLYGVTASDPSNYLVAVAALGGTGLLACAIPASRAAHTDPLVALRSE